MTCRHINTVLLDLDGVIRHFDSAHAHAVEQSHGVAPGALAAAAFDPELLVPAITGRISRDEWARRIGATIGHDQAARDWLSVLGTVDDEMLGQVEALRRRGLRVALLTNGTDTVDEELRALGVAECFDAVFNSARIGFAKPDPRVFHHVCEALGVRPREVFFADDSPTNVAGAIDVGMSAAHFVNVHSFCDALVQFGVIGE